MADAHVTLVDAIGNVEVLDEIPLSGTLCSTQTAYRDYLKLSAADPQPCIEALAIPLQYRVSFDTKFEDKNAFVSSQSRFVEEAVRHAQMVSYSA